jgi:hypothetical protein
MLILSDMGKDHAEERDGKKKPILIKLMVPRPILLIFE